MPRLQPLPTSLPEPVRLYLEELRRIVHRSGRTLKQLEALTHVSDSNWSRYLSGQCEVPDEALEALARVATLSKAEWLALRDLRARAASSSTVEAEYQDRDPDLPVPRQLPAAVTNFVGRALALEWLDSQLACLAEPPSGEVVILTVVGGAGVGKTSLVVTWAHNAVARFPAGQLYADLQGHTPDNSPATPSSVLTRFVHAMGIRPEDTPVDEDELEALYRSLVAGRRMLVVLDNAASAEQVRPLVPGHGCVVVVTSRNALPGLAVSHGARVLMLDGLLPHEAGALLAAVVGTDRMGAEPDATAELAARCAHLPLALRIVAAKLQMEPHTTVADMTSRLRNSRLTTLQIEDDREAAVRAAFDLSYGALSTEERRAFRFLGLVPGTDVGHDAVAALLDVDQQVAERLLEGIAACHLIDRYARMRYRFHDLLREYSAELCLTEDDETVRREALERLLDHYIHRTVEAATLVYPHFFRLPLEEPVQTRPSTPLEDREAAMSWLDAEHPNLVAAVVHAASHGFGPSAWHLADAMRGYFFVHPCVADWLTVGHAALDVARDESNRQAAVAMHHSLGQAYGWIGDLPTAVAHFDEALVVSREIQWLEGRVVAHRGLGALYQEQGRPNDADVHYQAALSLSNLGFLLYLKGDFAKAVGYATEALRIFQTVGDDLGAAINLDNLGVLYHQLGRLDEAKANVSAVLPEYRRMNRPDLEAECLSTLARIHRDGDDLEAANRLAYESLHVAQTLKEMRLEVLAANTLGTVACRLGQSDKASDWHRQALDLAMGIGNRHGHVDALVGLASAAVATDEHDEAALRSGEAVAEARAAGFRSLEAWALIVQARAMFAGGDREAAEAACRQALAIHRESGCRLGEIEAERALAAMSPPQVGESEP